MHTRRAAVAALLAFALALIPRAGIGQSGETVEQKRGRRSIHLGEVVKDGELTPRLLWLYAAADGPPGKKATHRYLVVEMSEVVSIGGARPRELKAAEAFVSLADAKKLARALDLMEKAAGQPKDGKEKTLAFTARSFRVVYHEEEDDRPGLVISIGEERCIFDSRPDIRELRREVSGALEWLRKQ